METSSLDHEGVLGCLLRHTGILSAFLLMAVFLGAVPVDAVPGAGTRLTARLTYPSTDGFVVAAQPTTSDLSRIARRPSPENVMPSSDTSLHMVGVYLTAVNAGDEEFMDEFFARMRESGLTTFVFDVKAEEVYYASRARIAANLSLVDPLVDLPALVARARANGIYTIARFVALKDPGLAPRMPDAQIRHPVTGKSVGAVWVDGSKAETLAYNRELLAEVAASGVDEINLDYIRYPTEYSQEEIGLSGKEKAERVMHFLTMAREVIDAQRRGTKLGISTYAILGWNFSANFEVLGQDIPHFADIVDVVSPMAYPSTFTKGNYYAPGYDEGSRMYHLVYKTLEGYKKLVGPENAHKIRPWIQGYYVTERDLQDQVDAVYGAGLCGFTVWSAGNYYESFYDVWSAQSDRAEVCARGGFDAESEVQ